MGYFVVMLFCAVLAVFAFKIYKRDLLSPTLISAVAFFLVVLSAVIGFMSWNYVGELSITTVLIFILGLTAFAVGEIAARVIYRKKSTKEMEVNYVLSNKVLVMTLIFVAFSAWLMMLEIVRVSKQYGFSDSNFFSVLSFYRTKTGLFSDAAFSDGGINFFVKQLWKICGAINLVIFYYGFQRIMRLRKKINKLELALIVLILLVSLFQTFLFNGGRSIFFHYVVAYVAIVTFTLFVCNGRKITGKIIRRATLFIGLLILLFYLLLPVVGRDTRHGIVEYTTFSFGTAVPSLELYIRSDAKEKNEYIGEETFSGIYYTLNKIGVIEYAKAQSHEWRSFANDGTLSSNTYTSLRSYYKDFGIIGVILLQFIFGFIITLIYLAVKRSKKPLAIIIYFSYFYILVDQVRDEQFFSLISISTVANILFIVAIFYLYKMVGRVYGKTGR